MAAELALAKNPRFDAIGPWVDDVSPRLVPNGSPIVGRYCKLERLNPALHGHSLWEAFQGGDDVWDFFGSGPFPSFDAFLQHLRSLAAVKDPLMYTVIDLRSYKCLGYMALMRIDPVSQSIEAGFLTFSPKMQRSVIATEAVVLCIREGLQKLRYRRFEWKCNHNNAKSVAAAVRFGFTYEGSFRCARIDRHRSRDTAWFSILAGDEFAARNAAYERWLRRDNFLPADDFDVRSFWELKQKEPLSAFLPRDAKREVAAPLWRQSASPAVSKL